MFGISQSRQRQYSSVSICTCLVLQQYFNIIKYYGLPQSHVISPVFLLSFFQQNLDSQLPWPLSLCLLKNMNDCVAVFFWNNPYVLSQSSDFNYDLTAAIFKASVLELVLVRNPEISCVSNIPLGNSAHMQAWETKREEGFNGDLSTPQMHSDLPSLNCFHVLT